MGIPGYTRWLRQRFSGAFHAVRPSRPLAAQCPAGQRRGGFDHVHFDLAARLYMVSGRAQDTGHLVRLLLRDLHRVVRWVAPRRSVTLAIDGVPPAAKLWTQRIRRFDRKRGESGGSGPSRGIDTLSFTLGTLMMRQIGLALSFFAVQALQARDFASTVFYVSGPEVIGEGEHKLHARVLSLLGSCPAESHLIIGNDADLIVQACAAAAVVEERQAALPPRSRLLPGGGAAPNGTDSFDQLTLLLTCGSTQPSHPCLAIVSQSIVYHLLLEPLGPCLSTGAACIEYSLTSLCCLFLLPTAVPLDCIMHAQVPRQEPAAGPAVRACRRRGLRAARGRAPLRRGRHCEPDAARPLAALAGHGF
jgi:hypothetical protein